MGTMQSEAYWENLVKRSLCRFFLLAQLAKGPVHGYRLNQAIRDACQGCCEPTEVMVYSTMRELMRGGYVQCRTEEHQGRKRRVCWLTTVGEESFRAAARVWEKMLPAVGESIDQALGRLSEVPPDTATITQRATVLKVKRNERRPSDSGRARVSDA